MFTYEEIGNGKVQIYRFNKPVKIMKRTEAAKFIGEVSELSFDNAQGLMARVTRKYKLGNERKSRDHPRNKDRKYRVVYRS